mmetsp:Transcript_62278/g.167964  ORF Transcript_62278/g.167964 Transcript_62278/m.167964 type:complete len:210 (+) Transcript_62278:1115-1744(+)
MHISASRKKFSTGIRTRRCTGGNAHTVMQISAITLNAVAVGFSTDKPKGARGRSNHALRQLRHQQRDCIQQRSRSRPKGLRRRSSVHAHGVLHKLSDTIEKPCFETPHSVIAFAPKTFQPSLQGDNLRVRDTLHCSTRIAKGSSSHTRQRETEVEVVRATFLEPPQLEFKIDVPAKGFATNLSSVLRRSPHFRRRRRRSAHTGRRTGRE